MIARLLMATLCVVASQWICYWLDMSSAKEAIDSAYWMLAGIIVAAFVWRKDFKEAA